MNPTIPKVTDEWITQNNPCKEAVDWWDKNERDPLEILKKLIKVKKYSWMNWFIVRIMTYHDYVSYAVFAAEQVINIYEKKYPDDKRPRQAIEAAKKCIDDPSEKNKEAAGAAWAAAEAARAAAEAAWAATGAAWAAAGAAWAAAGAAVEAARAAAEAAAEAARAAAGATAEAARAAMQLKILNYGMKLLEEPNA